MLVGCGRHEIRSIIKAEATFFAPQAGCYENVPNLGMVRVTGSWVHDRSTLLGRSRSTHVSKTRIRYECRRSGSIPAFRTDDPGATLPQVSLKCCSRTSGHISFANLPHRQPRIYDFVLAQQELQSPSRDSFKLAIREQPFCILLVGIF